MANSNIELIQIYAKLGPVPDGVTVPVRYVVATGANLGVDFATFRPGQVAVLGPR